MNNIYNSNYLRLSSELAKQQMQLAAIVEELKKTYQFPETQSLLALQEQLSQFDKCLCVPHNSLAYESIKACNELIQSFRTPEICRLAEELSMFSKQMAINIPQPLLAPEVNKIAIQLSESFKQWEKINRPMIEQLNSLPLQNLSRECQAVLSALGSHDYWQSGTIISNPIKHTAIRAHKPHKRKKSIEEARKICKREILTTCKKTVVTYLGSSKKRITNIGVISSLIELLQCFAEDDIIPEPLKGYMKALRYFLAFFSLIAAAQSTETDNSQTNSKSIQ